MSKRFKAKIDWEDSGWSISAISGNHVRQIGPFSLYVDDSTEAKIWMNCHEVFTNGYSSTKSAKQACLGVLRGLLK